MQRSTLVLGLVCGTAWLLVGDALAAEVERPRPRFVIQDLETQAESGDPEAMFRLAQALQRGRGVKEDDVRAAELYLLAAERGHAAAMTNLGVMHSRGEGVARDDGRAERGRRRDRALRRTVTRRSRGIGRRRRRATTRRCISPARRCCARRMQATLPRRIDGCGRRPILDTRLR